MHCRFTVIFLLILMPVQTLLSLPAWVKEPDGRIGSTLFYIERSRDPDLVMYTLNTDEYGGIIPQAPIKVFWYRKSAGNKTEPLTKIQEKLAYGIRIIRQNNSGIEFYIAAYPEQVFNIKFTGGHPYSVTTKTENDILIINKIYIEFSGGTFWLPIVGRVDLYGRSAGKQDDRTYSYYPNK